MVMILKLLVIQDLHPKRLNFVMISHHKILTDVRIMRSSYKFTLPARKAIYMIWKLQVQSFLLMVVVPIRRQRQYRQM